ncbi:hypothetical protein HDU97_005367 [Phlyctochytrium planicorne]|nr:hypothetical protein HDU97_005367 [Phlyctochytrium planicorne]
MWTISPDLNIVQEVKDKDGLSLGQYFNLQQFEIISASMSSLECSAILVLVQEAGRYRLVKYSSSDEWISLFVFPKKLSSDTSVKYLRIQNSTELNAPDSSTFTLSLTGITFGKDLGNELFLWGNSVLYSPDGGISMYQTVSIPSNLYVTSFSSASTGAFAFSLSDNSMYYGQIGTAEVIQIRISRPALDNGVEQAFVPNFDPDGVIAELGLYKNSTGISMAPAFFDLEDIIQHSELLTDRSCPYSDISFVGTFDALNIRDSSQINATNLELPSVIFLDMLDEYIFSIEITPSALISDPSQLDVGFNVYGPGSIKISFDKKVLPNGNVFYKFVIWDAGLQDQSLPGEVFSLSVLKLYVIPVLHSIAIYSGCAPYQHMVFDYNLSSLSCPDALMGLPCFFFEDAPKLRYLVVDDITSISSVYTDNYRIRIIAGGPSLAALSNYSESTILSINPNSTIPNHHLIWASGHEDDDSIAPVMNINKSEIT